MDDLDTVEQSTPKNEPVPYDRFAQVIGKARTHRAAAETATAAAATARATATTATQERDQAREELALSRVGINDPDGVEVARLFYGRLPPEGRPSIADWAKGLKATPDKIPPSLAPYLKPADTSTTTSTTTNTGSTSTATETPEDKARAAAAAAAAATSSTAAPGSTAGTGGGKSEPDLKLIASLTDRMMKGDKSARAQYEDLKKKGLI